MTKCVKAYAVHNLTPNRFAMVRNYKNGKQRIIGKEFKTLRGVVRHVAHRNAVHRERYGTEWVEVKSKN